MPVAERVAIDVRNIRLVEPGGGDVSLAALPGVQVVVLLRHRH